MWDFTNRLQLKWKRCYFTCGFVTYKFILKGVWRRLADGCWRGGRHRDIWGMQTPGPRGNYLIKGLLRHRNTEVCMRDPQLPAASHNKQVYYFILFIYWLVLKSGLLAIRVPEIFLISEQKTPKQIKKKLFFLEVGKS